ncbi:MAG TPA: site-specific integrase [Streptosporangiaceae bacterium]
MRPADRTFPAKTAAEQWLTRTEADILDGDWIDPDAGLIAFGEYAAAWIDERPNLRPKTIRLYKYLLRRHLVPHLGSKAVAEIKEPHVRRWRKGLLDAGTSPITAAKAYRLLKSIMSTAADDGLIRRNPCRIKAAGQEKSPERPVLTAPQVFHLADVTDPRYRALILLAVFASLRWGELAALRRKDIDLVACTVRVERTLTGLPGGGHIFGPPKSDAGQRTVAFPDLIVPDLTWHMARFTAAADEALVFTSPLGMALEYDNFRRRVWLKASEAVGLHEVHFHDLRHTGNQFAADTGAGLRELMDRMGHSSTRAALIYLHATSQRQRTIADAVGAMTRAALQESQDQANSGPPGADVAHSDGVPS